MKLCGLVRPPSRPSWSPSARREWVEIRRDRQERAPLHESPSARREWVEMQMIDCGEYDVRVSLREEGVG